ncbi:uncharacterized protein Tco025E_08145, partial [Trypanosoma conorhini]
TATTRGPRTMRRLARQQIAPSFFADPAAGAAGRRQIGLRMGAVLGSIRAQTRGKYVPPAAASNESSASGSPFGKQQRPARDTGTTAGWIAGNPRAFGRRIAHP